MLLARLALAVLMFAALAAPLARAQSSPPDPTTPPRTPPQPMVDSTTSREAFGHEFARGGPRRPPEAGHGRDTTKVLPFGAQLWGEGGFGGMVSPQDVRRFFQVGMGGGLLFRVEPSGRTEAHVRIELQALPRSTQLQAVDAYGNVQNISLGGNGMRWSGTAGGGVRVWHRLWAEAGLGVARLQVATGNPLTNDLAEPPAITAVRNTTGLAAEAQLAWRFPITDTQSMSVTLGWQGHRAGGSGRWLDYVPFRIGYRFL